MVTPAEAGPPPEITWPAELPVLPLKGTVVFPDAVAPLAIGEERSIRLVDDVMDREVRRLVLVSARDAETQEPAPDDLYDVGVVATVEKMLRVPDGSMRVLVHGGERVRLTGYPSREPFLVAVVDPMPDMLEESDELRALAGNVQAAFARVVDLVPYLPDELNMAAANLDDPSTLSYLVTSSLRLPVAEKQELLEEVRVSVRLRRLSEILAREIQVLELGARIQAEVEQDIETGQREFVLRQQLKAIQDELGEGDEAEINELRRRIGEAPLPDDVRTATERELARLGRIPDQSAEHQVIRTYLDWILDIPWGNYTEDDLDLHRARRVLDEDHYDIERVKRRILEELAVAKLKGDASGTVILFAGPPGVGKTSLGRSIARTLGREFARISVGGVRDEAEIRGHRRTYVGAMPGSIVRAIRDAGSMNPVIMIDEIDKMGSDVRGDPSSAMLEVLDPAQNSTFRDHYLDLPLDLSKVLFVCTANVLDTIPRPLLDRMELISLPGYTDDDKVHIARQYLIPRQLEATGVPADTVDITDAGLATVISEYTREAGVRGLERRIGALLRRVALHVAQGRDGVGVIGPDEAREMLGPERVHPEAKRRTAEPGVATGLAVTGAGGDILFVEASVMPGKGSLVVTGQLGEVMRESVRAALTCVRARGCELGLDLPEDYFSEHDIHVHVPAGAIPKDGPSAGITIATALVSALSGRTVSADVAMTGEITLMGQVLPVGGVRDKVLAALRAGIHAVVIPAGSEDQLEELSDEAREQVTVVLAGDISDVVPVAIPA
ncbi:MAG: endopeptidase La [Actinobacteria bacterium]|nr:endopeptidase La [Actinomycetota bacterium]MBM3697004.1 endopeptidase La [Actinomycetota bacterium]